MKKTGKILLAIIALIIVTANLCGCSKAVQTAESIQVDTIYINGKIYTVDDSYPWATAMAVKDGKFVYVGDDKGAEKYQGEIIDLKGQFVMPGIVDSHTHIAWGSQALVSEPQQFLWGENKAEVLELLKQYVEAAPEAESFSFVLPFTCLGGEKLTRDELDNICSDRPVKIVELEQHSRWLNTKEMAVEGIDEDMPDIVQGLSYCERDENGKINGRIYEWCGMSETYKDFSAEVYENGLDTIMAQWEKWGIVAAYDAGQQANDKSIGNFFNVLMERDKNGDLPVYIQGSYYIYNPNQLDGAIDELKRYNEEYSSEHVQANIMKIMMDGTMNGRTAALVDNYADVESNGATLLDVDTLTEFIIDLNEEKIDLHVHTVGDRAVRTVLDAVENARKELGDKYKIQVTCAHIEAIQDDDIERFAELGVIANFTPAWFGGNCYVGDTTALNIMNSVLGEERAAKTYRANTIWNTGALISFSSDSITLQALYAWNPYEGIETGMTRQTPSEVEDHSTVERIPDSGDQLSLDKLIKGYTLNGAIQMGLDDRIGNIKVGKEASFLVFENNLFDIDVYDIHKQIPKEFYIRGELVR